MGRHTVLKDHLTIEELEHKYLSSDDIVERNHWQILWMLAQGKTATLAAEAIGYSNNWVGKIVKRYNEYGPDSLIDHRHNNQGGKFILNEEQMSKLKVMLQGDSLDGGLWNSRKVSEVISKETGRKPSRTQGWRYLKYLNFTLHSLRPKHLKSASDEEKAEFKKNSMRKWVN